MRKIVSVKNDANIGGAAKEAYKVLRANIQFCGFDKQIKSIVVTSCNPGDGKSTTAMNMAISIAESGHKTLLIDADMRKPMMSKNIRAENYSGLSSFLSGHAEFEDILNETDVPSLYIMTSGPKPPNPVELIGCSNFTILLEKANNEFDYIVIDTPPLGSVIDCALISAKTDGTILVIKPKTVNYKTVQRVKEQLEKANAKILGVVLNKLQKRDFKYYYGYYYYYGENHAKVKKRRRSSRSIQQNSEMVKL